MHGARISRIETLGAHGNVAAKALGPQLPTDVHESRIEPMGAHDHAVVKAAGCHCSVATRWPASSKQALRVRATTNRAFPIAMCHARSWVCSTAIAAAAVAGIPTCAEWPAWTLVCLPCPALALRQGQPAAPAHTSTVVERFEASAQLQQESKKQTPA
jgi:hypothetical protein